jgi:alpha-methylacyl-CoA racemase
MAVGAIEPQFYAALLDGLGLDPAQLPAQMDPAAWPQLRERFAGIFRTRTRAAWSETFEGTDACVSPVLTMAEAALHPHNTERRSFLQPDGLLQAAPAPRFSRSRPEMRLPPPAPGEHSAAVLADFGFVSDEIEALRRAGAIA